MLPPVMANGIAGEIKVLHCHQLVKHPPRGFVDNSLYELPTSPTGLHYYIVFFKSNSTWNDEGPWLATVPIAAGWFKLFPAPTFRVQIGPGRWKWSNGLARNASLIFFMRIVLFQFSLQIRLCRTKLARAWSHEQATGNPVAYDSLC